MAGVRRPLVRRSGEHRLRRPPPVVTVHSTTRRRGGVRRPPSGVGGKTPTDSTGAGDRRCLGGERRDRVSGAVTGRCTCRAGDRRAAYSYPDDRCRFAIGSAGDHPCSVPRRTCLTGDRRAAGSYTDDLCRLALDSMGARLCSVPRAESHAGCQISSSPVVSVSPHSQPRRNSSRRSMVCNISFHMLRAFPGGTSASRSPISNTAAPGQSPRASEAMAFATVPTMSMADLPNFLVAISAACSHISGANVPPATMAPSAARTVRPSGAAVCPAQTQTHRSGRYQFGPWDRVSHQARGRLARVDRHRRAAPAVEDEQHVGIVPRGRSLGYVGEWVGSVAACTYLTTV